MNFFNKFRKKKAIPVKPLETPPEPEGIMPITSVQFPQQNPMPEFSLPQQQRYARSPHEEPEEISYPMQENTSLPPYEQQMQFASEIPTPPQEDGEQNNLQRSELHQPQQSQQMVSQTPQFKFYQTTAPEETTKQDYPIEKPITHPEVPPFDISQELQTLPEMHKKEHPELYAPEKQEEKKKQIREKHVPKRFVTVESLYGIEEQFVNLAEDISLAKDTAFRLTDINEQEIEEMVKWYALQQSIELRVAEIDKLLFKTK